jgi:L-alanine-DL-glutamate epimerase-like enolase superfamily enzyme
MPVSFSTDIRVVDVRIDYEHYPFRSPLKFGGAIVDNMAVLNAHIRVETRSGQVADGVGAMPLGNVWSFPSAQLGFDDTMEAMKDLAERIVPVVAGLVDYDHPVRHALGFEQPILDLAESVTADRGLVEAMPKLCALVVASPFDAALHDAFGKAIGLPSWQALGPDFLSDDLGVLLGDAFAGRRIEGCLRDAPAESLGLYHLVGALDPLTADDVATPIGDGHPETLMDWVRQDGLTHLKIKLNGDDLAWDVDRVASIHSAATEVHEKIGVHELAYSLDFNERCENVDYLIGVFDRLREVNPDAFDAIHYVEQPTSRHLSRDGDQDMHRAAEIRPVVIDESLVDLETLLLARDLGYSGAALKTCKGHTHALLMAAAAHDLGLFLCVQDLTCPGRSFIHSAGLAARVKGIETIEGNARQFIPQASVEWAANMPELFRVQNGRIDTSGLTGAGLSY